jgi:hypothetical protein
MPQPSTAPAFGDADIPALMADMGIRVTVGGVDGIGLLDEADQILVQDVNRGEVVATATTLTIQSSAFPNARIDDVVSVGSKNFTVRERLRESDGGLTKLLLGAYSGGPYTPPPAAGFTGSSGPRHYAIAGTVDGANMSFTLPGNPDPAVLVIVWNGMMMDSGNYTLGAFSGGVTPLTTGFAPVFGDDFYAMF